MGGVHLEVAIVSWVWPRALAPGSWWARLVKPPARAHARSGDPVAIAACLGGSDAFDRSISDFSQRYADQNERDYQEFVKAIRSGRLEAREGA